MFDSIPAPETVGEDAAKKLPDGRFGGMFKNFAKYGSVFLNATQHLFN
jgi:hypothetical protein